MSSFLGSCSSTPVFCSPITPVVFSPRVVVATSPLAHLRLVLPWCIPPAILRIYSRQHLCKVILSSILWKQQRIYSRQLSCKVVLSSILWKQQRIYSRQHSCKVILSSILWKQQRRHLPFTTFTINWIYHFVHVLFFFLHYPCQPATIFTIYYEWQRRYLQWVLLPSAAAFIVTNIYYYFNFIGWLFYLINCYYICLVS